MSDIRNENVNIQTQINNPLFLGSISYSKEPDREFLSVREPRMLNILLDRIDSLNEIRKLFTGGCNVLVIYGASGLGKSALANIYYHHFNKEYEQKGWVHYNLNICKSIVKAFDSHYTEVSGRKNDVLYSQLAGSEISYLKNNPKKRLIVINGVSDWTDIQNHIDFFQIKDTHFLFTATAAFPEKLWNAYALKVVNFPVPRITDLEVKSIFRQYCNSSISSHFIEQLNSNIFLINLIIRQAPKNNPKAIQNYFETVFDNSHDEVAIISNVLDKAGLSDGEVWTLLQIAALPEDNYDAEDLSDILMPDNVADILDIGDLKGFRSFKAANPGFQSSALQNLDGIVLNLIDTGWLTESEDEQFSMHNLIRLLLKDRMSLEADYFYEISNSLSLAFFTEFSGLILDDLKYEIHLQAFLDFLPEQPKELYIQNLEKLIALVERNGHYYRELALRQKHLALLRKSSDSENARLAQTLIYISDCQRRCGDLESAKSSAIESLSITEAIPNFSPSASQTALGLVLQDIGDYQGAKVLLEKAMVSIERNFGTGHSETAISYSNLAGVLQDLGDYQGAKTLLEKAMVSTERNFGTEHPETAIRYSNLATVLQDLGDYQGAKVLLEKAVVSNEKNFGPEHPETAITYSNLARVLQDLGDYQGAKVLLEKAIAADEKNFGPEHPSTAIRYSNLAGVLQDLGDYQGAKVLLEKAVVSNEKNFGPEHPSTAIRYSNLATVLQDLGDYQGAKVLLEKAMAADEKNFGPEHPSTAIRYSNLALVLKTLGDYQGAKVLLEKAMASNEKNFGTQHPETARSYSNLAGVLKALGDYQGAKVLLEKAMAADEKNFGPEHPSTARSYSNLALVLKDLGDYEGAKVLLEKAMVSNEKNFGPEHPSTAISYSNLALVLQNLGDYEGAKVLLEKAMTSAEKNFGPEHPSTAIRYSNLALVLKDLGDYEGAKVLLEKAMTSAEKNFGPEHPSTARSYSNLATVLKDLGDYQGAKVLLEKAMAADEKNFGTQHPETAIRYSNFAVVLKDLGDFEAALTYSSNSVRIFEAILQEGHPHIKIARAILESIKADMQKKA